MLPPGEERPPLVSVVVPVYAVENFLPTCVKSIIEQSYTDLEILLVNDGSPDSSGSICEHFASTDTRIRVIHKTNGGLGSARNAGVDIAMGEYICFVDSDDWVDRDYVKNLLADVYSTNSQIAVCGFTTEYPHRSDVRGLRREGILSSEEALFGLYGPDYLPLVVIWNKLFKTELLRANRFREDMVHEDEQISAALFLSATRVVCRSQSLYHYRVREDSITDRQMKSISPDLITAYEDRLGQLKEGSDSEVLVQLTVQRLTSVLLHLLGKGVSGRASFDRGLTPVEIRTKLQVYSPRVRPRVHPIAIWSRFVILAPTIGPIAFSLRCRLRERTKRILRRLMP